MAPAPEWFARKAGCAGLWFLWFKAMGISALVWAFGLCFVVLGLVLPWHPLPSINAIILIVGCAVFVAAYKLDRLIWRSVARARKALKSNDQRWS